jgi:hypothetical protein
LALPPSIPKAPDEKTAQRQAAQQDVFLREVDDALREEQMRQAIKRWGVSLGVALVVAIVGLGGYLWWDKEHKASAGARSEQFVLALDAVEARKLDDGAVQLGTLAKASDDGTEAAALVMQGAVAAEQGKTAEAKRLFEQIAADESAPQPYRDLSAIRAVAVDFDAMPPADVVSRLKPLAEPGKAWFGSAGELVGMAYLKQDRRDLAGALFAAIAKDKDVPQSQRTRARQMAALLGVDAIDDVARAAGMKPGQS